MAEAAQVEVGAELAVDARQEVQVEGSGDACLVVVGRVQRRGILLEVDADQHLRRHAARQGEEGVGLVGRQVADGGAGEIDHARCAPAHRDVERPREVAGQRRDAEPRELARECARGGAQGVLGDVDRHVDRRAQRADQQAALDALAAAVLDQLAAAAGEARDGREVLAGERELGAGYVVLGKPADAREQAAARGIVEVFGRERLLRARKPGNDVLAKNR